MRILSGLLKKGGGRENVDLGRFFCSAIWSFLSHRVGCIAIGAEVMM